MSEQFFEDPEGQSAETTEEHVETLDLSTKEGMSALLVRVANEALDLRETGRTHDQSMRIALNTDPIVQSQSKEDQEKIEKMLFNFILKASTERTRKIAVVKRGRQVFAGHISHGKLKEYPPNNRNSKYSYGDLAAGAEAEDRREEDFPPQKAS